MTQDLGTDTGYYNTSPSQLQYSRNTGDGSTQQTTPQTPNTPSSIPDIILTGEVFFFWGGGVGSEVNPVVVLVPKTSEAIGRKMAKIKKKFFFQIFHLVQQMI